MSSPVKLAVLGGTGFLSRAFLSRLSSTPLNPAPQILLGSRHSPKPHLPYPHQSLNISSLPDLQSFLQDATHVINLVGILHPTPAYSQTFASTQLKGAENLVNAIQSTPTIRRVVHISAIGASTSSPSEYARTKAAAEETLLTLPKDSIHLTILRPSIVYGPEDSFFNRFNDLTRFLPFLPLVGGGTTKYQPVHVDDVAAAIIRALRFDSTKPDIPSHAIFELGGRDILTFEDLMRLTLTASGKKRLLLPIPFPVASAQGALFETLHQLVPSVPPLLTRDQVKLLRSDNIVTASLGLKDLGIDARGCTKADVDYLA